MDQEYIQAHLHDREWRLNNLYFIKDEKGNKIPFRLNPVQKEIHDNLWFFVIIPKARQLGVTTFFCILYLDQVLFSKNKSAGIIFHKQDDMKKKFRNVIKYAWDNLPSWLQAQIGEPNTDSAYELAWKDAENNEKSIYVSLSTRGSTVQFLHISEFGYICQKSPDKAEEIVTGAINSVHAGQMVSIESTAAGRDGYFYEFAMEAEKNRKEGRDLTPLDFKIFFFPWYLDIRYTMDENFLLSKEEEEYFRLLQQQHGIALTMGQKRWYVKKRKLNGDKMFAEFPSTLDEAFSATTEGAFYAKEMNKVYLQHRIQPLAHDTSIAVETWWDLGMNDFNVLLFVQLVGTQIRFLDVYQNSGEGLAHYVGVMEEKKKENGWRYSRHILPHDVNVKELGTGLTRKETLWNLGVRDITVAPKLGLLDGIEIVRKHFPRFVFDEKNTQKLTEALQNYRRDFDPATGQLKAMPKHDKASHISDAVRTGAVVYREPAIGGEEEQQHREREQSFFG